ncbi:hypothetical protein [uncultured Corynebacterium sp.]|uniref:hypothetical protein n=1 Tax=uncultured Corynebacterium sp. TaxID=159447 RepID=UPI0025E73D67|nr:hypothetical protein [uncultured Corynebacterium sp.]
MKRTSVLALFAVAAMGLSACGSEDSDDAADSGSSANASAQQDSAAKGEASKKDDSKKDSEADKTTRAKSTKKSGPNPTVPGASDQAPESSPGNDSSSEPRRNARTTPSKVGGACGTTAEGAKLKAHEATSCEFARAIYQTALKTKFEPFALGPDATPIPRASISVTSPVNNESYDLKCLIGSANTDMDCTDQNDRSVGVSVGFPNAGYLQRAMPQVLALYNS